jgi:predicted nucleotidyltransferase
MIDQHNANLIARSEAILYEDHMMNESKEQVVHCLQTRMNEIRLQFGVRSLAIFGSVSRSEDHSASDIDILVQFDGPATLEGYVDLKAYLEGLLNRPVDLVTTAALKPRLKHQIQKDLIHVA